MNAVRSAISDTLTLTHDKFSLKYDISKRKLNPSNLDKAISKVEWCVRSVHGEPSVDSFANMLSALVVTENRCGLDILVCIMACPENIMQSIILAASYVIHKNFIFYMLNDADALLHSGFERSGTDFMNSFFVSRCGIVINQLNGNLMRTKTELNGILFVIECGHIRMNGADAIMLLRSLVCQGYPLDLITILYLNWFKRNKSNWKRSNVCLCNVKVLECVCVYSMREMTYSYWNTQSYLRV